MTMAYEEIQRIRVQLREAIHREMVAKGMIQAQLAVLSNTNKGFLSDMLSVSTDTHIGMERLHSITEALGLAAGTFYASYIGELFQGQKLSSQRCKQFVWQCVAVGRMDLIHQVTSLLLNESQKNTATLFAIAESLMRASQDQPTFSQVALYLYEQVITDEPNINSELIAISQYRRFRLLLSNDTLLNWKLAVQIEPILPRLPVQHQLDAYLHLISIHNVIGDWTSVGRLADELVAIAHAEYTHITTQIAKGDRYSLPETEHSLVKYYGKGYLMKGFAHQMVGDIPSLLACIELYGNLDAFAIIADERIGADIQTLKQFAQANRLVAHLLSGKLDVLPAYLEYLRQYSREILAGLVTVTKACLTVDFPLEYILEMFGTEIESFFAEQDLTRVKDHYRFRYQLALYLLRHAQIEAAIEQILIALQLAHQLQNHDFFLACLEMFEDVRQEATPEQVQSYRAMLRKEG